MKFITNAMSGVFDISITSPPYFRKELYDYKSENNNQSHKNFDTYEQWVNGFLKPFISVNYKVLNDGGYFCVNIANVSVNSKPFPVADDFVSLMSQCDVFFEEIKEIKYSKDRNNHSGSDIYIYKKKINNDTDIDKKLSNDVLRVKNQWPRFFNNSDAAVPAVDNPSNSRKRKRGSVSYADSMMHLIPS